MTDEGMSLSGPLPADTLLEATCLVAPKSGRSSSSSQEERILDINGEKAPLQRLSFLSGSQRTEHCSSVALCLGEEILSPSSPIYHF